jgi:transposase InsO family protein
MPKHWNWAVLRRREEWFKFAGRHGVTHACKYFGISRKTYYKWYKRYQASGNQIQSLQDRSRRPQSHPKTAPKEMVNTVIRLRKQTDYGPRRLQFFLERDFSLKISTWGIYKVIDRAGLIKRTTRKKKRYQSYAQYIRYPGHKIQVDVKYVPRNSQLGWTKAYQYSAKDLYTKLRFIRIYDELSAQHTVDFTKRAIQFFPFKIKRLQTDHGIEFTYSFLDTPKVHPLDALCHKKKILHTLSPVATPRYNGQVERGHRTDMEEFYRRLYTKDPKERDYKLLKYLRYYNESRPHMSLGMLTPFEKLKSFKKEPVSLNYECYL